MWERAAGGRALQMDGLRQRAVCGLSVAVFSICACATSAKRLTEDLQTDGFTIRVCSAEEEVAGPSVTVTDAESTERLLQWFRDRPRASNDFETELVLQIVTQSIGKHLPTVRIETNRFCVNLPVIVELPVVLETRATPDDEWNKACWTARNEDLELQQWAMTRVSDEYKLLMERGQIDRDLSEE
jgi:hypothetical protein